MPRSAGSGPATPRSEISLRTAQAIRGLRPWVTNEHEHDGLRVSNGTVLRRLIGLARGLT